ncbi:chaperonin 10-like protein [Kockovaella imperatae]|uniref:Chaperonin 10-like protein n=1 Tax=Kockovaella imperatae TaxID=4999 RepID=A0A1Y1UTA0_9TREE|nr:chaperonin 10-like protein [Kockovaella imperatae]ORX40847.1 chaperonin 10-like protein [Kockovaella imperatae]
MQYVSNKVQDAMGPVPTATKPEYKHREDGSTMRALAWFGNKDVRMVDAPIPDISEDKDVIIKVTGTTICGSDLHLYHSEMLALQKGDILGHEFMGIIDRVGPAVKTLTPGDKVVVSFQVACGTCKFCQKKWSSMCDKTNNSSLMASMYGQRDAGFFGYGHMTGGFPGGQAEYVRIPFGEVNCLKVPPGVSDEQVLYLSDVLPTSYHSIMDTRVEKGDIVGVWGLGPIGQACVRWALLKGASKVYAIDKVPSRLAMAQRADGQVIPVDFSKVDVIKTIQDEVPSGLDVCIDSTTFHEPKTMLHKVEKALMLETDVSETPNEMIVLAKKFGRIGLIGVYSGFTNHFNIGALMEKGIRFIGNGQAPVHLYWQEILNEYIVTGKFDVTSIVTHRVDIEDFPELYKQFDKRVAGVSKVFVQTKASEAPGQGFPQLSKVSDWADEVM